MFFPEQFKFWKIAKFICFWMAVTKTLAVMRAVSNFSQIIMLHLALLSGATKTPSSKMRILWSKLVSTSRQKGRCRSVHDQISCYEIFSLSVCVSVPRRTTSVQISIHRSKTRRFCTFGRKPRGCFMEILSRFVQRHISNASHTFGTASSIQPCMGISLLIIAAALVPKKLLTRCLKSGVVCYHWRFNLRNLFDY